MAINSKNSADRQYFFYKQNTYKLHGTDANISSTPVVLSRIYVNASSSGSLFVYDDSTTGTTYPVLTISAAAKDSIWLDVFCKTGLYVKCQSCTATVIYKSEASD